MCLDGHISPSAGHSPWTFGLRKDSAMKSYHDESSRISARMICTPAKAPGRCASASLLQLSNVQQCPLVELLSNHAGHLPGWEIQQQASRILIGDTGRLQTYRIGAGKDILPSWSYHADGTAVMLAMACTVRAEHDRSWEMMQRHYSHNCALGRKGH